MPPAHRHRDLCTGHGCYPPRPNATASQNVIINGRGAHRLGDSWESHCCGDECHGGTTVTGSSKVFVNGRPKARVGDAVSCGSSCMQGSPNVIVG